jgi:hypothetical protein
MKSTLDKFADAVAVTLGLALGIGLTIAVFAGLLWYSIIIDTTAACSLLLRAL